MYSETLVIVYWWLNCIPWWPAMTSACCTESWMDIKTKTKQKNRQERKWWWSLSIVGGREGGRAGRDLSIGNWESCLLQFVGLLSLSLVPFLKYYTRWSHAHTHTSSIALLWSPFVLRTGERSSELNVTISKRLIGHYNGCSMNCGKAALFLKASFLAMYVESTHN